MRAFVFSPWYVCVLVTQSCLTLCDPMDCSPPGFSVHETLQARILEWVAISFSRGSSQPRDQIQVSCIAGRYFAIWATRETLAPDSFFVFCCLRRCLSRYKHCSKGFQVPGPSLSHCYLPWCQDCWWCHISLKPSFVFSMNSFKTTDTHLTTLMYCNNTLWQPYPDSVQRA